MPRRGARGKMAGVRRGGEPEGSEGWCAVRVFSPPFSLFVVLDAVKRAQCCDVVWWEQEVGWCRFAQRLVCLVLGCEDLKGRVWDLGTEFRIGDRAEGRG
jgi:hypothetical protein